MRRPLVVELGSDGLTHLPGNLRLLIIALVVLSLATMLTLAF